MRVVDICAGFQDPSALLKHELAYCLGQMKNTAALSTLESVLADQREDPMVRHEVRIECAQFLALIYAQAAEAMGAISSSSSLPVLKRYLNDSNRPVRETCEIAIAKVEWDHSEEGQRHRASTSDEPQSAKIRFRSASCFSLIYRFKDIHLGRPCPSSFWPPCAQGNAGERCRI